MATQGPLLQFDICQILAQYSMCATSKYISVQRCLFLFAYCLGKSNKSKNNKWIEFDMEYFQLLVGVTTELSWIG